MGEDADVLRFRSGEPLDAPDEDWGDPLYDELSVDHGVGARLGELTKVVLIGDRVVDVVRRPISGSGYECAALELQHTGPLRRPSPPPVVPAAPAHEQQLTWLARLVGGEKALAALTVEPLEAEALQLGEVHQFLRERVLGIDARLQELAPRLLGAEGLTAARRLLTRAAAAEPALITRSDRDDIAAGAVIWAVAKGNDLVGSDRPVRASVIKDLCGLRSSPSARGQGFAHAVAGGSPVDGAPMWGFHPQPAVVALGSPDLLLSRFRRVVILYRDLALTLRKRTPAPA